MPSQRGMKEVLPSREEKRLSKEVLLHNLYKLFNLFFDINK